MLDRIGDEVARATSMVRYAPGSSFARHEHAMGEEFLVLEGIFSDEHGDYPPGTYVRNPPGSGHSPHSDEGCRILVKLRQFDDDDLEHVVIDTCTGGQWEETTDTGVSTLPLHQYQREQVRMLKMAAGSCRELAQDGVEIFVVSGSIRCGSDYPAESWLRFPVGAVQTVHAIDESVLWIKNGHLLDRD